ncbi:keto-deoxy-phosphogluconate aldolase [Mastigocoleus sp. MO_188.B34]|uniref:keto-deoxy-phosphogluconate aldolase n=1 Tax=Mastigocoleus sp. MO_188.B34 TaxID=3036635 RepID=UPI002634252F|nr:keto-deoxy-phosphogluconate aldolase [Mastigocoleus sp. MO_188.B34]MDJ0698074.1 keto-deoxy-phosphogluconate aldolase [Mastigocoleus sp. MO_188.B34]
MKVSWNNPGSRELISQLRIELPNCTIGAGTHALLKQSQVKEMITAGCQFIFTSYVNPLIINTAVESNLPVIPSALTPTEIVKAWQSGAVCIKVFPIQSFGGKSYIKNLQGPLGHIPLIAAGGITLENAEEFLTAGALAIELNRQLFPKKLVANGNWEEISQKAAQFTKKIVRF